LPRGAELFGDRADLYCISKLIPSWIYREAKQEDERGEAVSGEGMIHRNGMETGNEFDEPRNLTE
jgi:hypothetical protein